MEEKDLKEWTDQRFEELETKIKENEQFMIDLQQQINAMAIENLSMKGGMIELKKLRKEFLKIEDEEEDES